jgi:hypothetical protein
MDPITFSTDLLTAVKPIVQNLSVEDENLASIPFAVLEQRVGKRISKLEVKGSKTLPDGTAVEVVWQVHGNSEVGLPTEQDLDIFLALGVLTFRSQFSKTIQFQGREIAKILNINGVHGKFYDRLKLFMDRFIPLRFRALAQTDRTEDVKWMNVFQEASFSLDRDTGRCIGTITWTDKIIQTMNCGLFRLFDSDRYMQLDGLTAKHMYRFLAVAFESTPVVLIDVRRLATQHLGIMQPPKYLSRLMQTLEPALEQLRRIEVVGNWHVVSKSEWRLAICRHENYIPERQALAAHTTIEDAGARRQACQRSLEDAGLQPTLAKQHCDRATAPEHFYSLERAARLLRAMNEEGVVPPVGEQIIAVALQELAEPESGNQTMDWVEIGLYICEQKRRTRREMRNGAGLIVKLARDVEARERLVSASLIESLTEGFRRREQAALRQHQDEEERRLLLEYEQFRSDEARRLLASLPEETRHILLQKMMAQLKAQDRYGRLSAEQQIEEAEVAMRNELARQQIPVFEKWRLRGLARQAMLPLYSAAAAQSPN